MNSTNLFRVIAFKRGFFLGIWLSFVLGSPVCLSNSLKCKEAVIGDESVENKAIADPDKVLIIAIQAEEIKRQADQLQYIYELDTEKLSHISKALNDIIDNIFENETITEFEFQEFQHKIKKWNKELAASSVHSKNQSESKTGSQITWDDLMKEPSLVKENTFYFVEFSYGFQAKIIFYPSIVVRFFNSSSHFYNEKVARKLLRTMKKGFVGQEAHFSGIKSLTTRNGKNGMSGMSVYNQLLEIRTLGESAGHIRLGGFKKDDEIHIAHYIINSDHSKIRKRFIAQLLNLYKRAN